MKTKLTPPAPLFSTLFKCNLSILGQTNRKKCFSVLIIILLLLFAACSEKKSSPTGTSGPTEVNRQIVILYTNDEHGWMEPADSYGGAAGMVGLWRENEDYSDNDNILVLSGGDMWTGPAISTWFQGESMVEVMNAMGYDAAAIGNHEFDFKIEVLKERIIQANFPFLSANIREKQSGENPDFATPYVIREVNGVKVGIIGLSSTTTPWSTFPTHVADYDFIPYETALDETVPAVKAEGAELLILIGHICYSEMLNLVPKAKELGIAMIGGGHCSEEVAEVTDGIGIVESGKFMHAYNRVDIIFNAEADTVVTISANIRPNQGGTPAADIQQVVDQWRALTNQELSQVIGYVNQEINQYSNEMYNMVTDSWLFTFPEADVSMTNKGGIRQSIPAGEITLATIVGVLPFENYILKLELSGAELIDCIGNLVVGGMTTIGGYFLSNGNPIVADSIYTVLTTDYLYAVTSTHFQQYDPDPVNTAVNYRQPLIDWIISLNTSPNNPLDNYLDPTPRQ